MSDSLVSMVRRYSDQIKNHRTIETIHTALCDEVTELSEEVYTDVPGVDGVAGEAVDVLLCCLDIIFKSRPDWSEEDIVNYAKKKCEKWKGKYSNG